MRGIVLMYSMHAFEKKHDVDIPLKPKRNNSTTRYYHEISTFARVDRNNSIMFKVEEIDNVDEISFRHSY